MTIAWETAVRNPGRLRALEQSGLVDSGPEDAFDRLIELAAELTGVPRGCITLVDGEQTIAKSAVGFPAAAILAAPIELSFCRFVVSTGRPLIVDDAHSDPRTKGDPAIEAFAAVTWAGYPIENTDGVVLGTFCLMDSAPHEWTASDLLVVATLAKAASSEIALRRTRADLADARREVDRLQSAALSDHTSLVEHLHQLAALDATGVVGRGLLAWLDSPGT